METWHQHGISDPGFNPENLSDLKPITIAKSASSASSTPADQLFTGRSSPRNSQKEESDDDYSESEHDVIEVKSTQSQRYPIKSPYPEIKLSQSERYPPKQYYSPHPIIKYPPDQFQNHSPGDKSPDDCREESPDSQSSVSRGNLTDQMGSLTYQKNIIISPVVPKEKFTIKQPSIPRGNLSEQKKVITSPDIHKENFTIEQPVISRENPTDHKEKFTTNQPLIPREKPADHREKFTTNQSLIPRENLTDHKEKFTINQSLIPRNYQELSPIINHGDTILTPIAKVNHRKILPTDPTQFLQTISSKPTIIPLGNILIATEEEPSPVINPIAQSPIIDLAALGGSGTTRGGKTFSLSSQYKNRAKTKSNSINYNKPINYNSNKKSNGDPPPTTNYPSHEPIHYNIQSSTNSQPQYYQPPGQQYNQPPPQPPGQQYNQPPPQGQQFPHQPQGQQSKPLDPLRESKLRADYRVKFSILREAYPQMMIPEPADNQSVEEIEAMFKSYTKRIHIDCSVEQNQTWLYILWMVIELIGSKVLRLPFKYYTQNQDKYMNKYRMLLIELGESSYGTGIGEGWPIEMRILFMAVFNAVLFVLVNMLCNKIAGGYSEKMTNQLTEMISNFLTQNNGKDILKKAAEATADNPPPPMTAPPTAPPPAAANPLAGLGGLGGLASFLPTIISMFTGSGGDSGETEAENKPERKKPTTFAGRRKQNRSNKQEPSQI